LSERIAEQRGINRQFPIPILIQSTDSCTYFSVSDIVVKYTYVSSLSHLFLWTYPSNIYIPKTYWSNRQVWIDRSNKQVSTENFMYLSYWKNISFCKNLSEPVGERNRYR